MRVLALDTSTELGSVAVLVGGTLRAEIIASVRGRHGETLLSLVAQALAHASIARTEIDLVATGIGPGSFTGTRIGVATAKGLALAMDRPLLGVVSLRAMARAAPGRFVVTALDAFKGELYAAVFERDGAGALVERLAPFHASPADAMARAGEVLRGEPAFVCGSGLRRYPAEVSALDPCVRLSPLWDAPRASVIALEAQERFEAGAADERASLEPLYVRGADATPAVQVPAQTSEGLVESDS